MKNSAYFRKTIYYEQSPAALEYWQTRVHSLFATDESESWLDAYSSISVKGRTTADTQPVRCVSNHWNTPAAIEGGFRASGVVPDNRVMGSQEVRQYGLCLRRLQNKSQLLGFLSTCRDGFSLFIIRQRHSFSRLNITRELFDLLAGECQIFPQFKEFVLCFGVKREENETGPPQLRYRLGHYPGSGDSSVRFECAYVLRFVELNHRHHEHDPWSLRQSGIYHQYTTNPQSSTWLFISMSSRAQARMDTYIEASGDIQHLNPFEVHLLLLDTAMANWRPYLVHMTSVINEQAGRVTVASGKGNGPLNITEFEERQELKYVEDKILDVLIVMDSTLDTIDSLSGAYHEFCSKAAVQHPEQISSEHELIGFGLAEKRRDILLYRSKVQALRSKVKSNAKLVTSLLDHGNGHSLKILAEAAHEENVTMRRLTEKATQDAASVKVLTIVTLVYLPATAVLNFFSTQFVNQVSNIDQSLQLTVASNWWIFLAVSLPLTTITFYIWWIYAQKYAYGVNPVWWTYAKRVLQAAFLHISEQIRGWRRPAPQIPN